MPFFGTITHFCIIGEISALLQWYVHLLLLYVRPSLLAMVQPYAPAVIQSTLATVPSPPLLWYQRPLLVGWGEFFALSWMDSSTAWFINLLQCGSPICFSLT